MSDKLSDCAECGMPCTPGEYHPHAACLMFKCCHDSDTVRAGLAAIREHALAASPAPAISESDVLVERMTKDDWRAAFNERHEFDIYPDDFMTGLRNEFAAGWYAALKTAVQSQSKTSGEVGTNTGHGHAWARPDGMKVRCGGPMMCKQCAIDAARKGEKS